MLPTSRKQYPHKTNGSLTKFLRDFREIKVHETSTVTYPVTVSQVRDLLLLEKTKWDPFLKLRKLICKVRTNGILKHYQHQHYYHERSVSTELITIKELIDLISKSSVQSLQGYLPCKKRIFVFVIGIQIFYIFTQ